MFQNTKMSAVINKAGWAVWQKADTRTTDVSYSEYKNTGTGAAGPRASFAKTLGSAVSMSSILGGAAWVDHNYV